MANIVMTKSEMLKDMLQMKRLILRDQRNLSEKKDQYEELMLKVEHIILKLQIDLKSKPVTRQ